MKTARVAHIVVVADSDHGMVLSADLCRMGFSEVATVDRLDAARRLCRAGGIDVCTVAIDDTVADARLNLQGRIGLRLRSADADDRRSGQSRSARVCPSRWLCGAAAATIPPRMLYRRVCAVVQRWRAADHYGCRHLPSGMVAIPFSPDIGVRASKSTLH